MTSSVILNTVNIIQKCTIVIGFQYSIAIFGSDDHPKSIANIEEKRHCFFFIFYWDKKKITNR